MVWNRRTLKKMKHVCFSGSRTVSGSKIYVQYSVRLPLRIQGVIHISVQGFRHFENTTRQPGEYIVTFTRQPGEYLKICYFH